MKNPYQPKKTRVKHYYATPQKRKENKLYDLKDKLESSKVDLVIAKRTGDQEFINRTNKTIRTLKSDIKQLEK